MKGSVVTKFAHRKPGRVNVKAVVILLSVVMILGVGAVVGRKVRSRIIADNALSAAKTALEAEDWSEAAKQLNHYLNRRPEDVVMLEEYARVNLRIRPREASHLGTSAAAYRMLLRHKPDDAEANHRLGEIYNRLGNFVEAEHVARKRLDAFPGDDDARMTLAVALYQLKRLGKAAVVLKELVETSPDRVQAFSLLAALSLADGTVGGRSEAGKWLDKSVQANPDSVAAWIQRARFRRKKEGEGARKDLDKAEQASSPTSMEYLAIATEWLAHGSLDRAEMAIRAAGDVPGVDDGGEELDLPDLALASYIASAKLALMQRDRDAGLTLARSAATTLNPDTGLDYLPYVVELFLRGGQVEEARTALEEFRSLMTARASSNQMLRSMFDVAEAAVAAAEGTPYLVIKLLEDLPSGQATSASEWKLLWQAFEQTGQSRRALRATESYLALNPEHTEALIVAARLARGRDPGQSRRYASRAAQSDPQGIDGRLLDIETDARSLGETDDPAAVQQIDAELDAVLKIDPTNLPAHALRMRFLLKTGRPDEAEAAVRIAESACDDPASTTLLMLEVLALTDRAEAAEEVCAEAIVANPASFDLRMALARLQYARKAVAEAIETMERAIDAMQGESQMRAEYAVAELLQGSGDAAGAVERLRKIAAGHPNEVRARQILLNQSEVFEDDAAARALVDDLRRIEGERGLRWQLADARLRLREADWRDQSQTIEDSLKNCLRGDPGWPEAAVLLGAFYEQMRRPQEAENTYRRAYDASPEAAGIDLVARFLDLLLRRGKFMQASSILSRLPTDDARLRGYRIGVALGQRNSATAIDELTRRLEENPSDVKSMVLLSQILYSQSHNAQRALELLDRAATVAPEFEGIAPTRAYILHNEDRDDEALTMINAEVDRRGDYASIVLRAGFRELIGHLEQAEGDFRLLTRIPDSQADGFAALGDFLVRHTRGGEAVRAWNEALSLKPGDIAIEIRVLNLLVMDSDSRKREEARPRLDELLGEHPDDPRLLYLRAGLDVAEGSSEAIKRAVQRLEHAVTSDPGFAPAHAQLIGLAMRGGAREGARELIRRANRNNVRSAEVSLARAEFELISGNSMAARSLAESVLKQDPKNVVAGILLARIVLAAGDPDAAMDHIEAALRNDPTNGQAIVIKAELLRAAGQAEEAILALGDYLTDHQYTPALLSLASMEVAKGDYASADTNLRAAEALAPDHERVVIGRLDWLGAQGRFDEVSAIGAREASSDASRLGVLTRAAGVLSIAPEKAFRDRALPMLKRAVEISPRVDLMVAVGQLSYQAGLVDQAVEAYQKVLDADQYNVPALNDLAWLLATDLNDPEAALKLANRGIGRDPSHVHLLDTRGVIYFLLGRFEESRIDLEACLARAGDLPATRAQALLHLARTHISAGDPASARQRLDEADQIDHVLTDAERVELDRLHALVDE